MHVHARREGYSNPISCRHPSPISLEMMVNQLGYLSIRSIAARYDMHFCTKLLSQYAHIAVSVIEVSCFISGPSLTGIMCWRTQIGVFGARLFDYYTVVTFLN